jgi:hypothetical protein
MKCSALRILILTASLGAFAQGVKTQIIKQGPMAPTQDGCIDMTIGPDGIIRCLDNSNTPGGEGSGGDQTYKQCLTAAYNSYKTCLGIATAHPDPVEILRLIEVCKTTYASDKAKCEALPKP